MLRTVLETYVDALEPRVLAPARARATGPLDEVFSLLESYRGRLLDTDCTYGCPIGRLALEIDPENTPAHALIARNFDGWTGAVADALRRARVPRPGGRRRVRAHRDGRRGDAVARAPFHRRSSTPASASCGCTSPP